MQNRTSSSRNIVLTPLNRTTARRLHPTKAKVLQFGEGNFLRAFADWMIDVMNEKTDFDGSVQIIQPIPSGMCNVINEQDGLYHVRLNGMQQGQPVKQTRLIGSVKGALDPHNDFEGFLSCGENPDLRIILSNTTEAGIAFDPMDVDPSVLGRSFPAKLTQLLYHRYRHFDGNADMALTVLPCELIDRNGETLCDIVLRYATLWNLEAGFHQWITEETLFCNTLVDRIVPGYPKGNAEEIKSETGYDDRLMVMAELFHLWVIEPCNKMKAGQLIEHFPIVNAGLEVKVVDDLKPYRTRKVRILNGAHTAMVPVAYLRGIETVRDAIEDPVVGKFMRETIWEEIIPTLDLPPDELDAFASDVVERFRNPFIRHELASIALNSISKFRVRVLPSILSYVERMGVLPHRLVYSLAALVVFYKGTWRNRPLPVNDNAEILEFFKNAWKDADPVRVILSSELLWEENLTKVDGLYEAVRENIQNIENQT